VTANIKQEIHRLLKKYWGYDHFRPLQEEIITSVLQKHDTLALLPTGGGKSICFQVSGLALGGATIVVSPLISLMNDQVENLKRRGISAVAISAAMTPREIDIALGNAVHGHVQFIYLSPERLQNEDFRSKLSTLPVTLIAVDEAHCISQWGYDFRPSYLKVAELRAYFPGVNVVALTASATTHVQHDIRQKLLFTEGKTFRQSFSRPNLRYVVQLEENRLQRLLRVIASLGGSGVVYVRNRRKTAELVNLLKQQGIAALAYHAGLTYDDRQAVQEQWVGNKVQVICATNAFGMGIDKPDVRFVAHLDLPDSLEAYFQEAGRAGRDGKTAYAVVLFSKADQQRLLDNFRNAFPDMEEIRKSYQAICNYYQVAIGSGEGLSVEFDIDRICGSYNLLPVVVYNSVKFLGREGYLSLLESGSEPSKVMMLAGKEQIYEYELRNPRLEPLVKTLLRSYGGLFENYVHISEKDLAYRVKLGAVDVSRQLQQMDKDRLLSYLPQSALPRLMFVQDRVDARYLYFNPENYQLLKDKALERIRSVIDYTNNDTVCRQVQLLIYFNEQDYSDCGFCDVCLSRKPKDFHKIKDTILGLFSVSPLTIEEVKARIGNYRDETWVQAFNELVDDGILKEEGPHYRLAHRP
jgi:ATP-dependent DNA helicase RecQ